MWQSGWEGNLRGVGRMDTCISMAESLCCEPETITTQLISYTAIQNKKLKKKDYGVGYWFLVNDFHQVK